MTGVAIIKVSTPPAAVLQIGSTSATITRTENQAVILTGVEGVGPPGPPGGAPASASYVTLATDATLTAERVLTAGTGITITDGGAGSTVTVGVTDNTYQPLDSDLTAIAALSTTTYGRALLALADAAAARTALGLGTVATLASDTDGTLAANSDSRVATQKATKTYADGKVPKSTVTAKGDLIAATGSAVVTNVAVGTNGKALVADSTQSAGVGWSYPVPSIGNAKTGSTTYYMMPGHFPSSSTTQSLVGGVRYFFFYYLATPMTCDQLAFEQVSAAVAGKLVRVGLIAADKWWQPTGSALFDSGNLAADGANGVKTYTPASPVALPAGRYLATLHSDGTPGMRVYWGPNIGMDFPTGIGGNITNAYHRVTTALAALDTTAWDTVSPTNAQYNAVWFRFSDPAP